MAFDSSSLCFEAGTLEQKIAACTQQALRSGALQSISTEYERVEDAGISFVVRILANLVRKEKAQKQRPKDFNPFLPYEADLFVTDLSETHLCLLNKFNVVDHHILLVTHDFESQERWLNWQDFQAVWACLSEIDGFAFYNGGKAAGASQPHKHLQIVPLPLVDGAAGLPVETAIAAAEFYNGVGRSPLLPFAHAIGRIDCLTPPDSMAKLSLTLYQQLLAASGIEYQGDRQTAAYNWLATRRWMMVVARSCESYQSIAVNALGYGGSLLVRNSSQMQQLKQLGALNLLSKVGRSFAHTA
ncbi:MAG: phosphorylase [Leptolyngbyaceae cyanobacterium SL_1_1]|nr:phosphorylase [Leptolyngbyaceae cyanobacterium RM1_1_2]NJO11768.1 phosphorylase [Leptolyngbyaceae cyanobacterium SL_1_1]